ncbi:MAG: glycoside hydrolase [Chloroflexi bacterium]|nr:glycoside hydrolase [Chloroflexota bacterium]
MSLPELLQQLLARFNAAASVSGYYGPTVIGFVTPHPAFERWSLRLDDGRADLVEGVAGADLVIQAPLDVLRHGLLAEEGYNLLAYSRVVGYGVPGDLRILTRFAQAFDLRLDRGASGVLRKPGSGGTEFAMPLRHPAGENLVGLQIQPPQPLPAFDLERLPQLVVDEHPDWVAMYGYAWQTAFGNLRLPEPGSGFAASFLDTAFNDNTFMWDTCFMTLFGSYGRQVFRFIHSLDNFYARQHADGFICREINTYTGQDLFTPQDPRSTGPNLLAWAEWLDFQLTGDQARLRQIFPALVAYHYWLRDWRTWQDGSYWTSSLGSGMDNQDRARAPEWYHGRHTWVDATMQQALNCRMLQAIGSTIERTEFNDDLEAEYQHLYQFINRRLWDDQRAFYYDLGPDGTPGTIKSIGAYWGLLARVIPESRAQYMFQHLEDAGCFNRPHRVPSQSADSPGYEPDGLYWRGGVWPPTNYMLLRGLTLYGADQLAHDIARNHVEQVARVFQDTGTLWENYAPEFPAPSRPAKDRFVGWTGLSAIAIPIEYVVGLRRDTANDTLLWDVRLTERHGVLRYPLSMTESADLICAARSDRDDPPQLTVTTQAPLNLLVRWNGSAQSWHLEPGTHELSG